MLFCCLFVSLYFLKNLHLVSKTNINKQTRCSDANAWKTKTKMKKEEDGEIQTRENIRENILVFLFCLIRLVQQNILSLSSTSVLSSCFFFFFDKKNSKPFYLWKFVSIFCLWLPENKKCNKFKSLVYVFVVI